MKKDKNIFVFFLLFSLLVMGVFLMSSLVPTILVSVIKYYKYGSEFVYELFLGMTILIVMLLSKNSYVFTDKKCSFFQSLKFAMPFILLSICILIVNFLSLDKFSVGNCINLILYSFSIGIAEEFLCRGWIQNEFIERFGDSKKNTILSIFLASLIFGMIHIFNFLSGQHIFETLLQITQATVAGIFLGLVYYKTKNIWSVIFLHGFYDFSIMLAEVNNIKDCTASTPTKEMALFNVFCTIVVILFYILSIILLIKNTEFDKKSKNSSDLIIKDKKLNYLLWCGIIAMIILIISPIGENLNGYDDYYVCYEYEEKIIDNYETHFQHKDLKINYKEYKFELLLNDYFELEIKNLKTGKVLKLDFDGLNIYTFDLIENNDNYLLVVSGYDKDEIVYYQKIDKALISDSEQFFDIIEKSFDYYKVPVLEDLGYITLEGDEYKYPLLLTQLNQKLVITKNGELQLWDCDC